MQQTQLNGRKKKISPALDVEETFHQKRLGFIKYVLHEKHKIPSHAICLKNEKGSAVIRQIIVKTGEDGTPKFNRYHNIEEDVQKRMAKWLTKTPRNDCEQSRKGKEK